MGVIYLNGIAYGGGSGGGGGSKDYNELANKPTVNNVALFGNRTTTDLDLVDGETIFVNSNEKMGVGVISDSQINDLFN